MEASFDVPQPYFGHYSHGRDFRPTSEDEAVTLPRTFYDELLFTGRQFKLLSSALIRGGITTSTIESLIAAEDNAAYNEDVSSGVWLKDLSTSQVAEHQATTIVTQHRKIGGLGGTRREPLGVMNGPEESAQPKSYHHSLTPGRPDDKNNSSIHTQSIEIADDDLDSWIETAPQPKPQSDKRTILLHNLPANVTHRDVTNVVRGGRLIDIWLRKTERSATITFASGASDFLYYTKRTGLYIQGRRIDASWSERQFTIPQHLAQKVQKGVSRNLVIRGGAARVTEERIREDLDHIHNCVIIAVILKGLDIYVSLNSINNAMFARSCMSSRTAYKGLRIDWYPDECDEALPAKASAINPPRPKSRGKVVGTMANRFDLLNIDTTEVSSDEHTDDEVSADDGVHLDD